MKTKVMLTVGLLALFAVMSGYGQPSILKAKIDFPFKVESQVLPAGQYEFTQDSQGTAFRVQGEGKNGALVMILTQMAAERHAIAKEAHLVFDVVGDTHLLSEIWIPGEDGYMLAVTKGPHKHKVINVKY
ncbi:MAG: hypothetical protein NT147_00395 [Candidatus Aminicenantes bacterium]|nr:hypothetical protein [Candidatus Aminicenantes bacterium]